MCIQVIVAIPLESTFATFWPVSVNFDMSLQWSFSEIYKRILKTNMVDLLLWDWPFIKAKRKLYFYGEYICLI